MVETGISGKESRFLGTEATRKQVVLSTEELRILEQADQRREHRNIEQARRRQEDPDGDVSEDETDELAGILAHLQGFPTSSEQVEGEASSNDPGTTARTSSKVVLFTDSEAAQNTFSVHDESIPEDIITLVKCRRSPALQLFSALSLHRIRSGMNLKYVKVVTGPAANARILNVSDFPKDEDLTLGEWTICYNTFIAFMSDHCEQKVLQGLATHYDAMMRDPEFSSWFRAYLRFDMQIQSQFFAKPSIIDVGSSNWYQALYSAKNSVLLAGSGSSRGRTQHRGQRYSPYPGGRPNSFPSGDGSRGAAEPSLCLRCGVWGDHRASSCKSKETSRKERPFFAVFANGRLVCISDGRPICIRFNLGICSASQKEGHAFHVCSLCGDHRHGAQKHQ